MRVAGIRKGQNKGPDICLKEDRENVGQGYVAVVRAFVVPPAHMQTHLVPRNVLQRLVDRLDDEFDEADKVTERAVPVGGVSLQGEIGAIQLQQEAMADDRRIRSAAQR